MEAENETILAQDESGKWDKGVRRFHASADNAAKVLAWVVENTSRKRRRNGRAPSGRISRVGGRARHHPE